MKFILGTKQNMTVAFAEDGAAKPVTVLVVSPLKVTQVKTEKIDGYQAIQVGFGTRKASRVGKAQTGQAKGAGPFQLFREFRTDVGTTAVGDTFDISAFAPGDIVEVSAISKGKGFQGVIKRHGFKGGPRSHGQKHSERAPGSIGAVWPQRVLKGKRMGGRMGGDRVTVKNLKVVAVYPELNQLLISGAVPGRRGTVVEVRGK